jgi:maltooligosyltrehalose trehalohydrolase
VCARRRAAARRSSVAENEPQHTRLARPVEQGGFGMDALWNDDLHHTAMVAMTGRREAYYTDYLGSPQEFISAVKWGYLYQGQRYRWQKQPRGTPGFGLPPTAFINYIQNHDQVANTARGERLHQVTAPGRLRALTAYLLLAARHADALPGPGVRGLEPVPLLRRPQARARQGGAQGARRIHEPVPEHRDPEAQARLADPRDPETFERCKLDLRERESHAEAYALHRDLLALRKADRRVPRAEAGRGRRRGAGSGSLRAALPARARARTACCW